MQTLNTISWPAVLERLNSHGVAPVGPLLSQEECASLRDLFDQPEPFRSTIDMSRYGFGSGLYRYFADPLPHLIAELRTALYGHLVGLANSWMEHLREDRRFPTRFADWQQQCHAAGQTKPTPLLLRYGPGDYNCLHQDLYGDLVFPIQMAVMLSQPQTDFAGGEMVFTEQRPRAQSRPTVLSPTMGEAVLFAVSHFPRLGRTGRYHRVTLRHGVSEVRAPTQAQAKARSYATRMTLGVIMHDAH